MAPERWRGLTKMVALIAMLFALLHIAEGERSRYTPIDGTCTRSERALDTN